MSNWHKAIILLMFPVYFLAALFEPLWIEIVRVYNAGELFSNWRKTFTELYNLYRYEIWKK